MKVNFNFDNCILCLKNNADSYEHIIPRSIGGRLQVFMLCTKCNNSMGSELISKIKDNKECLFYMQETISNNWSRDVLELHIKSNLYKRQGKAITNFKTTLPEPQSDLANQTIKDPYVFDFMTLTKPFVEKDIENQLVSHITKFRFLTRI